MIGNLTYDFSVDKDNRTINIKREFAAEPARVWDALTRSDLLDQWWAPKPWKAKTKEMDFREGGKWIYAMIGPKGEEEWCVSTFWNIKPKRSYMVLDAFSDKDGNERDDMPRSQGEISLTDYGDRHTIGTFRMTYDDVQQLDATLNMGFKEGITMAFENLDQLLANWR